jgi:RHS repeat-associated protein
VRRLAGEKTFCPYLYQGQSIDEETGLAYNRFRYYDNESGNYLSQDPIGLGGGTNLYGYVNNTNNWVDLLGLSGTVSTSWNQFQTKTAGWFNSRQEASTGWKVYKESSQSAEKLAIGRLPDTEAAEKIGMRRLNTKGWTPAVNDAWMQGGIDAKKDFYLASKPIAANRINPPGSRFPTTVFDRELKQLAAAGYKQKGNLMKSH